MDKKRVLNIFLFIVILLIGAYFTMADQGALTVAGIGTGTVLGPKVGTGVGEATTAGLYIIDCCLSTLWPLE